MDTRLKNLGDSRIQLKPVQDLITGRHTQPVFQLHIRQGVRYKSGYHPFQFSRRTYSFYLPVLYVFFNDTGTAIRAMNISDQTVFKFRLICISSPPLSLSHTHKLYVAGAVALPNRCTAVLRLTWRLRAVRSTGSS